MKTSSIALAAMLLAAQGCASASRIKGYSGPGHDAWHCGEYGGSKQPKEAR